jgi:hypothetical protein
MPPELKGRLLTYDMLRAAPGAETLPEGETSRNVPLVLSGDEERYVWAINGQRFPDGDPPRATRVGDVYAARGGGIPVGITISHENEGAEVFGEWRRISDRR